MGSVSDDWIGFVCVLFLRSGCEWTTGEEKAHCEYSNILFFNYFFSQFRVITVSPDITPRGWLGSKCQLTNSCDYSPLRLCRSQLCRNLDILKQFLFPWPKLFSVSLKIHMCPCQNCSEGPPEERLEKAWLWQTSLLNFLSRPLDILVSQRTELN